MSEAPPLTMRRLHDRRAAGHGSIDALMSAIRRPAIPSTTIEDQRTEGSLWIHPVSEGLP